MIARWHLDLLAVAVLVGAVAVAIETISGRRRAPTGTNTAPPSPDDVDRFEAAAPVDAVAPPVAIPPAVTIGFALLLAGSLGHVDVAPLAAISVLAGIIACRSRMLTVFVAALYLLAPGSSGIVLPGWLLVLTALVLTVVLGVGSAGRSPGSAPVPLAVAAALWTAAPDTELPLIAGGALLIPALHDIARRRDLRPDGAAMATVVVAAAIGFVGRPAGAVVLGIVIPLWFVTASVGPDSRRHSPLRGALPVRLTATIVALIALGVACRTGGLRHRLDQSIPPTLAAGLIATAAAAIVAIVSARQSPHPNQGTNSTDDPGIVDPHGSTGQ